jgi:SWI/SNF-related matrix-associated actin-dependent regulator 1 of chromatin subfamily A
VDESHSTLLSAQRIERAKSMLKPFVLRRKKHQVIDLPRKTSHVEYCDLNSAQRKIYEHEKEEVRQLLADRAAGKKTGNRSANILMKLRQAAIHPLLYRRHYTDTILSRMAKACLKEEQWSQSNPDIIFEELQAYNDFECHQLCLNHPHSLGKFALKNDEWMNSGKVDKLCELLKRFQENGDRTLVFSQFTLVMDILEHVLETLHLGFVRLDGRTNVEDRQSILDAFHERTDIPVFLLSTKAGGAGINLACANKVVIFDSSFNPQEDVQAENRAHRVGQTREVEVIRLVTKDTIEEQIYALGQTKLALDQAVAGDETESKKGEEAGMKVVEDMLLAKQEEVKPDSTNA